MRWMVPENEPADRSKDEIESEKGISLILDDINDIFILRILSLTLIFRARRGLSFSFKLFYGIYCLLCSVKFSLGI